MNKPFLKPSTSYYVIALCLVCFALFQTQGLQGIALWFFPNSLSNLIESFYFWQLLSPIFVHYTWLHLLVNLYLWWIFAREIENHSVLHLVILLIGAGIFSNLCQYYYAGPKFGGLSGVIYALLSFMWVSNKLLSKPRYNLDPVIAIALVVLMFVVASGFLGKFSDAAHFSGLLFGAIYALLCRKINARF